MDKLIINAAITGMVPTRRDNPNIPVTVEQILADVRRCRDAGAGIVHIHARDVDEKPTCDIAVWRRIINGIREICPDILISGSTSGRIHRSFEERSTVLDCDIDMASLTCGSMNFPGEVSANAPEMITALAHAMKRKKIIPELEFFEVGMIDYARDYLLPRGILGDPLYANLLLGSRGTLAATQRNLQFMVDSLPADTLWAATGIGRFQWQVNQWAINMGGHVRVGLEDNLWMDDQRTDPASNVRLIDRLVTRAQSAGRDIASPAEVRQMLGLTPRTPQ